MLEQHNDITANPSGWRNAKRSPDLTNSASSPALTNNGEVNGTRNDRSSEASSNSPTTPAVSAPFVFPANDDSWKIIGSPPRKNSIQGPLPTMPQGNSDFPPLQESGYEDEDDMDLKQIRGRAASTPGTPNRPMNGIDIPNRFLHSPSPPGYSNSGSNNDAKWGSLGGFQWAGPSIWTEGSSGNGSGPGSRTSPPPGDDARNVSFSGVDEHHDISAAPMVPSVSLEPSYRQQRSLSFSMGQNPAFFGYGDEDEAPTRSGYRSSLPVMEEEDEYPQYGVPKFRSRSKSSGAAFGLVPSHEGSYSEEMSGPPYRRDSEQYSDVPGGWGRSGEPTLMTGHRRSVTTNSGYNPMWDGGPAAQAPSSSYLQISSADRERLERLRAQRRFSLAPAPTYHEYGVLGSGQDMRMLTRPMDEYSHLSHRRHSVAGTSLSFNTNHSTTRYLSDALESLDLGEVREAPTYPAEQTYPSREFMETVDEYFDNDDHRTRAYHEMGKGIPLHQVPHHGPLYVVEFKAGRTDLFYVADNSVLTIKKGDLVIVEADRGKDLGKVTVDNLTPQQVQLLQAQQADVAGDSHRMNKELHPKRIYRLAQPAEVTMLMGKSQDEAKAMMVCQTKVRQKKLPMEVVDAEYQWDRRKLTFYFIAERRIDFRELVRDLFKIYKTRIWMCAVNPLSKK